MNSDHHLKTRATKILGMKMHSGHTNQTFGEENTQFTSSLCVQDAWFVLNLPLKKRKEKETGQIIRLDADCSFWRRASASLCEQPHRQLLWDRARRTLDLFESAPTSPTQTHSSEQQIQSKARTETTCKRQRKAGDAGGGEGETTGGC